MATKLELSGVSSILFPYGAGGLDYFIFIPELLKHTSKIKFMVALRPYALSPEYASKTIRSLQDPRITINVVAGRLIPGEDNFVFNHYVGDVSKINTLDKRIDLCEEWTEQFKNILKEQTPELYTIADSPITLEFGKKYCDSIIFNMPSIEYNIKNGKEINKVLVIDPLIIDENIPEYIDRVSMFGTAPKMAPKHNIQGTLEEVVQQLQEISDKFGIDEFMIQTNLKDVSGILKLIERLSTNE